jgi:hypothetical protein
MNENINIYKKHIFNINYPDEYNELIRTLQGKYLDEVGTNNLNRDELVRVGRKICEKKLE